MTASAASKERGHSRIQAMKRRIILDAALEIFSAHGFRGATIDQIARRAGMSKPNLLYYFRRKEEIYISVLEMTLARWLDPLDRLDPDGDPIDEIRSYIRLKLDMSRQMPEASRLFANEILHGAPAIGGFLHGPLRTLVEAKCQVIRRWISQGKLTAVDPTHLIFMIWATTQHYADFDAQVRAVLDTSESHSDPIASAENTILTIFLEGLAPR